MEQLSFITKRVASLIWQSLDFKNRWTDYSEDMVIECLFARGGEATVPEIVADIEAYFLEGTVRKMTDEKHLRFTYMVMYAKSSLKNKGILGMIDRKMRLVGESAHTRENYRRWLEDYELHKIGQMKALDIYRYLLEAVPLNAMDRIHLANGRTRGLMAIDDILKEKKKKARRLANAN